MLERYSRIEKGMKREFILLQGRGCVWHRCAFCDYYTDTSSDPFSINRPVLEMVTGEYGVLDVINSGSAPEFDEKTISMIADVVRDKNIHDLWFEAHWIWKDRLEDFSRNFPCRVHYRLGIESFNPDLREAWNKGIGRDVTPQMIRKIYDGVCLLVGIKGQTEEDIMSSVAIAEELFDYYSVNLFCPNSTEVEKDEELSRIFIERLAPEIRKSRKAEVLIENTDLGVG